MTTYATAQGGGWIPVQCDRCRTRYGCHVEGFGTASNRMQPLSDQTLKDFAVSELSDALKEKAARIPCPKCGAVGEAVAEETQNKARRRTFWAVWIGGGAALLIGATNLLNALLPRADPKQAPSWFVWLILGSFISALVGAFLASRVAHRIVDPNRDLAQNKRSTQSRMAAGQVRILPEPGSK